MNELLSSPDLKFPPSVNQIEVHPFNTRPELTAFCKANGVVVEAYAPLARALRMNNPTIVIMAEKYNCTPAQLMVRWSIQKGYVPLPKSVKKERIVENANIGGFEISDEDMNALDTLNEYCKSAWVGIPPIMGWFMSFTCILTVILQGPGLNAQLLMNPCPLPNFSQIELLLTLCGVSVVTDWDPTDTD